MAGKITALLLILSLVLAALPLQSEHGVSANGGVTEVWVATTGSNGNPGTEAQPFATIQKGIDTVEIGDGGTVHVAAGTYCENLNISKAVDLAGAGAPDTIIDGGGSGRVIYISSNPDTQNVISGFTIRNGVSDSPNGGGIYIGETHIVTLNDCVVKDNEAERGGGIYNTGQLNMYRCTVSGNSAVYHGGGIQNTPGVIGESGEMWLTNCTISDNHLTRAEFNSGGGVWNNGTMTLHNCTIVSNSTSNFTGALGGGFANSSDRTAYFKNCIVANNTSGDGINNNGYSEPPDGIISQGCNMDSENSCNFTQPSDQINTDPLIGPLQDNGGPTFTHALLHGSPAIDAGETVVGFNTDQRAVPRPQGTAWDIGAYELTQASVATATGSGAAYFSVLNGYFTNLTAQNESALACTPREDLSFPHGLFSFTVTGITRGSSVTVVIILPAAMPANSQYWKCINGTWVDCTSLLGSNDGDNVLTITIKDGGLGDADGQENGSITDPGGPALVIAPPAAQTAVRTTPPSSSAYVAAPVSQAPVYLSNIVVQSASLSNGKVAPGVPVTVTCNIANKSTVNGTSRITLYVNGQEDSSRGVNVNSGSVVPVTFTVSRSQPGTYAVYVNGTSAGSFSVKDTLDSSLILYISLGLLILSIILALVYFTRRKQQSY